MLYWPPLRVSFPFLPFPQRLLGPLYLSARKFDTLFLKSFGNALKISLTVGAISGLGGLLLPQGPHSIPISSHRSGGGGGSSGSSPHQSGARMHAFPNTSLSKGSFYKGSSGKGRGSGGEVTLRLPPLRLAVAHQGGLYTPHTAKKSYRFSTPLSLPHNTALPSHPQRHTAEHTPAHPVFSAPTQRIREDAEEISLVNEEFSPLLPLEGENGDVFDNDLIFEEDAWETPATFPLLSTLPEAPIVSPSVAEREKAPFMTEKATEIAPPVPAPTPIILAPSPAPLIESTKVSGAASLVSPPATIPPIPSMLASLKGTSAPPPSATIADLTSPPPVVIREETAPVPVPVPAPASLTSLIEAVPPPSISALPPALSVEPPPLEMRAPHSPAAAIEPAPAVIVPAPPTPSPAHPAPSLAEAPLVSITPENAKQESPPLSRLNSVLSLLEAETDALNQEADRLKAQRDLLKKRREEEELAWRLAFEERRQKRMRARAVLASLSPGGTPERLPGESTDDYNKRQLPERLAAASEVLPPQALTRLEHLLSHAAKPHANPTPPAQAPAPTPQVPDLPVAVQTTSQAQPTPPATPVKKKPLSLCLSPKTMFGTPSPHKLKCHKGRQDLHDSTPARGALSSRFSDENLLLSR